MAKLVKQSKPSREVKAYAKKNSVAWQKTFEGILEVGQLLREAHAELDGIAWLDSYRVRNWG